MLVFRKWMATLRGGGRILAPPAARDTANPRVLGRAGLSHEGRVAWAVCGTASAANREALRIRPDYPEARANLATVLSVPAAE